MKAKQTFENFKVSSENQLAYSSALCLAAGPGIEANPLLLYGPSGSGKTHLLRAIHRRFLANNPNKKVLSITADQLGTWNLSATLCGDTEEFENELKSLDLLLVDDLDTIDDNYEFDNEDYPLTSTNEVIYLLKTPIEHNVKVVVVSRKPWKSSFDGWGHKKGYQIQLQPISLD
jgi:chromosomal replication initiation ATPase DnaA